MEVLTIYQLGKGNNRIPEDVRKLIWEGTGENLKQWCRDNEEDVSYFLISLTIRGHKRKYDNTILRVCHKLNINPLDYVNQKKHV